MLYVANAFSLQMIDVTQVQHVRVQPCPMPADLLLSTGFPIDNVIGHSSTDTVVRGHLESDGAWIPPGERKSIRLKQGDLLLVAQVVGGRLVEGTTTLPDGAKIEFLLVTLETPEI